MVFCIKFNVFNDSCKNNGFNGFNGTVTSEITNEENTVPSNAAIQYSLNDSRKYAGWLIGGYSSNAVFRDFNAHHPEWIHNAMTITEIDNRTIKLTTNVSASIVASQYRGVYWKIEYKNFEDIKGIWRLINNYNGYKYCIINSIIEDWGPGIKDVLSLPFPIGNNKPSDYDFYKAILDFKENQPDKDTGKLYTQGYFYFAFLNYDSSGMIESFEDICTLDFIPLDAKVVATEFSEKAEDRIEEIINKNISSEEKIQVTNWGDSLTAGAGAENHRHQLTFLTAIAKKGYENLGLNADSWISYSVMMQALLGDKYNVTNCGVGGESLDTIAARLGACVGYSKNNFTLPADTTPVQIGGAAGIRLDSSWGSQIAPLLQGSGNSVNPCSVEGIECILKWTGESFSDNNGIYTIQRINIGDRTVNFSTKTPIIFSGSKLYRNTKLAVLWCWQNGGYSDNNELIEKLDKMITHLNTNNYLIIGLHSGTSVSRASQEAALVSKYGDKFFNWGEYVSSNALYDFGITPTTDASLTAEQKSKGVISDEAAMAEGSLPMSLWRAYVGDNLNSSSNDNIHLTSVGYGILGFKIIERFKDLGYIE